MKEFLAENKKIFENYLSTRLKELDGVAEPIGSAVKYALEIGRAHV